ncbi:hypothetical protein LCGC14_0502660 [marine sediment metagenome]|uniref:Site-specific integrase n=2 Tax=root TaxID=1 RepID=A0A831QNH8_9FLAO|nr:site-specific integrase [Pricia antarctica]
MSKPQNFLSTLFIDYIPAELRENRTWEIVYYVKNPFTEELERKRNRVRPLKNITERRKMAKRMIAAINSRLEKGWNPFFQNKGTKELAKLADAARIFISRSKQEHDDGNFSYDTFKTYRSQINLLIEYLNIVLRDPEIMCYKFDSEFVGNYLDYVRYEKGTSARTRDNYLGFLGTFSNFLILKKYITANPTELFGKINKKTKKRILIAPKLLDSIFDYWKKKNAAYMTLSMACYYCLVRRTEITKLKVGNVSLINSTIWIDATDSKNRKSNHVTIPDALLPVLAYHIRTANNTDYLFSTDNFKPGKNRLHPDRITKNWSSMRQAMKLESNIHWYSLKDTGITDLLRAGVPLIAVRDQARHHSSIQTDLYTPREMRQANQHIKSANI